MIRILFPLLIAWCVLPPFAWAHGDDEYFAARRDTRKCAFPLCGGFFVQRANRLATVCADGVKRNECYVAEADLSAAGVSEEQAEAARAAFGDGHALGRGRLLQKTYDGFGSFGVLAVSEIWEAATDAPPRGTFYRLSGNGTVCIAYPCRSFRAETLNGAARQAIADPDFAAAGAGENRLNLALAQLNGGGSILVAGVRRTVKGPGGRAPSLTLSQFYLPLEAGAPAQCHVGGCSAELCSERPDAISPCVYLPEYACYRTAICERQTEGGCGWTASEELRACLEKARKKAAR